MVFEIQTQSENLNKMYPPKPAVENKTTAARNWGKDGTDTNLLFEIEYLTNTETFWASIQIMIGFVFALSVVMVVAKLNNW
jgi:hypothetical protein